MSEDLRVTSEIAIKPALSWAEIRDIGDWCNISPGHDRDVVLRVREESANTADEITLRRTADAVIAQRSSQSGYRLMEQLQAIVDRFGGTHTFSGFLHCVWGGGEDVWRVYVRDGRAVEVRPVWPDEPPAYVPAADYDGDEVWREPTGHVVFRPPGFVGPQGWARLMMPMTAEAVTGNG